jgi:hypothetical protein
LWFEKGATFSSPIIFPSFHSELFIPRESIRSRNANPNASSIVEAPGFSRATQLEL